MSRHVSDDDVVRGVNAHRASWSDGVVNEDFEVGVEWNHFDPFPAEQPGDVLDAVRATPNKRRNRIDAFAGWGDSDLPSDRDRAKRRVGGRCFMAIALVAPGEPQLV